MKLSFFDERLLKMIENLTEQEVTPKAGDNHYFFEMDYKAHHNPEWIDAVMNAIRGMTGERCLEITDQPDAERLIVKIKYLDKE